MANFGDIGSDITLGANQSVRRNGANNAFEAYTPSTIIIGSAVTGGGANRVLFQDGSQNLATDADLTFDGTNLILGSGTVQFAWGAGDMIRKVFDANHFMSVGFSGSQELALKSVRNDSVASINFYTGASGSALQRMSINGTGNVVVAAPDSGRPLSLPQNGMAVTPAASGTEYPGSAGETVLFYGRGFNLCVDSHTLSASYQPTFGVGIAVSRDAPALALKNNHGGGAGVALAVEGGRVGIGTATPSAPIHIINTTEQARIGYDAPNYLSLTLDANANATFNLTAASGTPEFTFSDAVNVPDDAYAAGWNGSTEVPTKNAVYDKIESLGAAGHVRTLSTNYISGTGTAGVDNTAQTVVTVAVAANTLTQVGDCIRVRAYWKGDTGSPITGTVKLNGVTLAATTDGGGSTFQVNEAWLHYVDSTHANLIAMAGGVIDTSLANNNVAGFAWSSSQNLIIEQDQIVNNHIVVYFLAVDIFPKGV